MNNSLFVTPSIPAKQAEAEHINKEPFVLPVADKKENTEVYIALMKQDSPVDFSNFDGVDFHKRIQPTKASLLENENKHFPDKFQAYILTEKQVKAVKEAANKRFINIIGKPNPKFGSPEDIYHREPEFLPAFKVCIGDYILLEKSSQFKPYEHAQRELEEQAKVIIDESQKVEEQIYKMQEDKKKKN